MQKALIIGQWIGLIWCVVSVAIVAISHYLIVNGQPELLGIRPFNVKDPIANSLLMFPGAILLGVTSWLVHSKFKK